MTSSNQLYRKLTPSDSIASNSLLNTNLSSSSSSSSLQTTNQWLRQIDKRLWRAIDFLQISLMIFSLFTAIILALLRNELLDQCPLYAKLYLRRNATQFSSDIIEQRTSWGDFNRCEFAFFTYLFAFVLSFVSLWIHLVFRRVIHTERLLRFPVGLLTIIFTIIAIVTTSIVTDGVIKFCLNSQANICTSQGPTAFNRSRWKIISLPVGGWLTTILLSLIAIARTVQLLSKPKKSPETLKLLLNQLMTTREQIKREKLSSEHGSQSSKDVPRSQNPHQYSNDRIYNREVPPENYSYYYPPIPQYRQIEKRSSFRRICCPCFGRRRQKRSRSLHDPYQPYVVPDEYSRRLNYLRQNETNPNNVCHHHHHHHSMHRPVEQQTQTDLFQQRKSSDETNGKIVFERRRSSVRFEDERSAVKSSDQSKAKVESIPIIKNQEENKTSSSNPSDNDLLRSVSFRNNEDDIWTTITINTTQSVPIQSSHFNRLTLENSSFINTSITNNENGVTAIHVNSESNDNLSNTINETNNIPKAPVLKFEGTPAKPIRQFSITNQQKPNMSMMNSRSHTLSSEDDNDLRKIKPVEEINAMVADRYNYNDLSQALKSNVERLKRAFNHAQKNQSHYDTPSTIRSTLRKTSQTEDHSTAC